MRCVLGLASLAVTIILLAIQQAQDAKWHYIESTLYDVIARKDKNDGKYHRTN